MNRREFLDRSAMLALLTASRSIAGSHSTSAASDAEARIASLLQVYDAQGNHRTATPGDAASAEWLAAELRALGLDPACEQFTLDKVEPVSAYVRAGASRIDGVPAFDAAFTGPEGVHGRLGALGSDAEIALVESDPYVLLEPQREQRSAVAEVRRSKHAAAVVLTRGETPGLYLLNAILFLKPSGLPILQVSSVESQRLKSLAASGAEVQLVAHAVRKPAHACNVTAMIAGRDRTLDPVIVTTPRSGWWQCTGERGGGIACWLEIARAVAAAKPDRDVLFAALSGHEVGFIGIEDYAARRPDIYKKALAWIHLGANIGVAHQPNLVTTSDDALLAWLADAFAAQGVKIDHTLGATANVRGEAGAIKRGGARYVTMVGGTDRFHHPADRWPDAVDVATLGAYARAFSSGVVRLAQR